MTCFGVVMEGSGYIVTSTVVVRDESFLEVELYDGSRYPAKLVGYDLKTDICILKIDGSNLRTASFGSGGMKFGDGCLYIGLGQREIINISQGLLGASEGRYIMTEAGYSYMKLTATDRVASDRCYGGVIVNSLGQIVGFRCGKADDTQSMIYAYSVEDARSIIDSIIKNGYVKERYTLGLSVEPVSEIVAKSRKWPTGLMINDTDRMKGETTLEVFYGDIIMAVNGQPVVTVEEYQEKLATASETITLTVYRPTDYEYFDVEMLLLEDTGLYMH